MLEMRVAYKRMSAHSNIPVFPVLFLYCISSRTIPPSKSHAGEAGASSRRRMSLDGRTHLRKLGWPVVVDVALLGAGGVVCDGDWESVGC